VQKKALSKKAKVTTVASPQEAIPQAPQKTRIGLTILPYQGRHWVWRPLIFVANLLLWFVWHVGWLACWVWNHKGWILRKLADVFWRAATLLSVGYLVYDRIYEADATLAASASDPNFAFEFPFTITNNSHVFAIRDVNWSCQYLRIKWGSDNTIDRSQAINGSANVIGPGKNLNIECSILGPKSHVIRTPDKQHIDEAVIKISLAYRAELFGIFSLQRHPEPTTFTWFADASNPQWIKGDFAK
jgi:hypothetical protein